MSVFSFLNPLLLWGLAAIAAPIIIHLLLRQKPKPRPWAAMRWIQAALHAAQRRYKITNLLLLLMRCLIVALLALAVSRPHWGLWSEGGDLVVLIDVSASMASDRHGNGPLQQVRDQLREAGFSHDRVCIISVGHKTQVLSNGDTKAALRSLQQLESDYLPGGLNRALEEEAYKTITSNLRAHSTLLCISDYRQDDGKSLLETLSKSVFQVARWQVGEHKENTYIQDIPTLPDFVAASANQFQVIINGQSEDIAQLRIDDNNPSPIRVQDPLHISIPPLTAGRHHVELTLKDDGLAFDNVLSLAIDVRAAVNTLIIQQQFGYIAAVVDAAHQQLAFRSIDPARLHTEPLPEKGIVIADTTFGNSDRISQWVKDGGVLVLWADHLKQNLALNELCSAIDIKPERFSGHIKSDEILMTRTFSSLPFDDCQCLEIGAQAQALLRLDDECLAARQMIGDAYIIVLSDSLNNNDLFWTQGATPFWLRNTLRQSISLAQQPRIFHAGDIVAQDLHLLLADNSEVIFKAQESLMLKPGIATEKETLRSIIILPNQEESLLALPQHDGLARQFDQAIPDQIGADWSLWILIALACLCIGEGLFAGHAGRSYGQ